jgi:uncharacterized LabA/DUF88 family protein
VFIDHWEFSRAWQLAHSKITGRKLTKDDRDKAQIDAQDVRWDLVPDAVLSQLDEMPYIEGGKELRAVDVYAPVNKPNNQNRSDLEVWLDEKLDPLAGFQVHLFHTKPDNKKPSCGKCGADIKRPDIVKGLNTKVACDMLSHAVKDSYDVCVLMMSDAELAPSILCVQEIFDKQVIHVGPKGEGEALRSAAWGHILFEDLVPDIITSEDFKKQYSGARTKRR